MMSVTRKAFRPGCVIELDGIDQRELREQARRLTEDDEEPTVLSELADWLELAAVRKSEET